MQTMKRAAAVLIVTGGLLATAGSASAGPADPAGPPVPPVAAPQGFYEKYRGHHIMGWGSGETACAYIDGVRLVLYSDGAGYYRSALQAYRKERGLRAVTKASVRALGDLRMATTVEPVAHCPQLTVTKPAKPKKK